jgi:hypothetical protein
MNETSDSSIPANTSGVGQINGSVSLNDLQSHTDQLNASSSTYSLLSVETKENAGPREPALKEQSPIMMLKNHILNASSLSIGDEKQTSPVGANGLINNDSSLNSSTNTSLNNASNNPLNEKVTTLASSIYTELEKIVKLHGRDTVKDLMSIVVNILGPEKKLVCFCKCQMRNIISIGIFQNRILLSIKKYLVTI